LRAIAAGAAGGCLVVDPWNVSGAASVFASAAEVAAAAGAPSFEPAAGLPIE
jgi:hypothetical protein